MKKFADDKGRSEAVSRRLLEFVKKSGASKRNKVIGYCVAFAFIFIILFAPFMFTASRADINTTRGYVGKRPEYKDYEKSVMYFVYTYNEEDGVYYLRVDPSEEEFKKWVYKEMERKPVNWVGHINLLNPYDFNPKRAQNYEAVSQTCEEVFNEVLSNREHEANRMEAKNWLSFGIALLIIAAICVGIVIWYSRSISGYITAVQNGEYELEAVTLIGREEYRTRHRHSYYIEARSDKGDYYKCTVGETAFYAFQSGKRAYLVIWESNYGIYDERDILV